MSESIRAGEFRICPSCGARNKAAHNFCVRCSGAMDAALVGGTGSAVAPRPRSTRMMRYLLPAFLIAALAAGLVLRTVYRATREASAVSEDVRADGARASTTTPPAPPPVSGWYPGANVSVEPDTAPTWAGDTLPSARKNPHDVPGDPNASMVGIAPRAPRARAPVRGQRVFTENDLLATRGTSWSTPTPEPARRQAPPLDEDQIEDIAKREAKLGVARARLEGARARLAELRARGRGAFDDDDLRRALKDAVDDLEDAQKDAAKATRKLEEARRSN